MPQCPQCNKPLREMTRKCPSCKAELDLLVDFVGQLQLGLEQAERYSRAGELGKAFWAYMAVLEVDPDNPTARRQVSQVVTAVRQFDRTSPGRRWLFQLKGDKPPGEGRRPFWRWLGIALVAVFLIVVFVIGYLIGANILEIDFWNIFQSPAAPDGPSSNQAM